ncbi:MAG TPA: ribonuclease PH, partial [Nannocystaceae bacterium]|nr:ribonuclease PH [Nannocystaceae bacterium]
VTGGFVALALALAKLQQSGRLASDPIIAPVAAVSVGIAGEHAQPLLDLCYVEDAAAVVDLNVVALAGKGLVEVQGTGEHGVFSRAQLNALLDLADAGIAQLVELQRTATGRA